MPRVSICECEYAANQTVVTDSYPSADSAPQTTQTRYALDAPGSDFLTIKKVSTLAGRNTALSGGHTGWVDLSLTYDGNAEVRTVSLAGREEAFKHEETGSGAGNLLEYSIRATSEAGASGPAWTTKYQPRWNTPWQRRRDCYVDDNKAAKDSTTWYYDEQGNVKAFTGSARSAAHWEYSDKGLLLRSKPPALEWTRYHYYQRDPAGHRPGDAHDRADQLAIIRTQGTAAPPWPLTPSKWSQICTWGRPKDPVPSASGDRPPQYADSGMVTLLLPDVYGNTRTAVDPDAREVISQYDAFHQLVSTTADDSAYEYDVNNNLRKRTVAELGSADLLFSDTLGQTISACSCDVRLSDDKNADIVAVHLWDNQGNTVVEVDPAGNVTRHQYEERGLLVSSDTVDKATGAVLRSRSVYDQLGNLLMHLDPAGWHEARAYNGIGQITHALGARGAVTELVYGHGGAVWKKMVYAHPAVGGVLANLPGQLREATAGVSDRLKQAVSAAAKALRASTPRGETGMELLAKSIYGRDHRDRVVVETRLWNTPASGNSGATTRPTTQPSSQAAARTVVFHTAWWAGAEAVPEEQYSEGASQDGQTNQLVSPRLTRRFDDLGRLKSTAIGGYATTYEYGAYGFVRTRPPGSEVLDDGKISAKLLRANGIVPDGVQTTRWRASDDSGDTWHLWNDRVGQPVETSVYSKSGLLRSRIAWITQNVSISEEMIDYDQLGRVYQHRHYTRSGMIDAVPIPAESNGDLNLTEVRDFTVAGHLAAQRGGDTAEFGEFCLHGPRTTKVNGVVTLRDVRYDARGNRTAWVDGNGTGFVSDYDGGDAPMLIIASQGRQVMHRRGVLSDVLGRPTFTHERELAHFGSDATLITRGAGAVENWFGYDTLGNLVSDVQGGDDVGVSRTVGFVAQHTGHRARTILPGTGTTISAIGTHRARPDSGLELRYVPDSHLRPQQTLWDGYTGQMASLVSALLYDTAHSRPTEVKIAASANGALRPQRAEVREVLPSRQTAPHYHRGGRVHELCRMTDAPHPMSEVYTHESLWGQQDDALKQRRYAQHVGVNSNRRAVMPMYQTSAQDLYSQRPDARGVNFATAMHVRERVTDQSLDWSSDPSKPFPIPSLLSLMRNLATKEVPATSSTPERTSGRLLARRRLTMTAMQSGAVAASLENRYGFDPAHRIKSVALLSSNAGDATKADYSLKYLPAGGDLIEPGAEIHRDAWGRTVALVHRPIDPAKQDVKGDQDSTLKLRYGQGGRLIDSAATAALLRYDALGRLVEKDVPALLPAHRLTDADVIIEIWPHYIRTRIPANGSHLCKTFDYFDEAVEYVKAHANKYTSFCLRYHSYVSRELWQLLERPRKLKNPKRYWDGDEPVEWKHLTIEPADEKAYGQVKLIYGPKEIRAKNVTIRGFVFPMSEDPKARFLDIVKIISAENVTIDGCFVPQLEVNAWSKKIKVQNSTIGYGQEVAVKVDVGDTSILLAHNRIEANRGVQVTFSTWTREDVERRSVLGCVNNVFIGHGSKPLFYDPKFPVFERNNYAQIFDNNVEAIRGKESDAQWTAKTEQLRRAEGLAGEGTADVDGNLSAFAPVLWDSRCNLRDWKAPTPGPIEMPRANAARVIHRYLYDGAQWVQRETHRQTAAQYQAAAAATTRPAAGALEFTRRLPLAAGVAGGTVFCDSDGVVDALLLNRFGEPWMMGRLRGGRVNAGTGVMRPVSLPTGPYIDFLPWSLRVAEEDYLLGRRGLAGWNGLSYDPGLLIPGPELPVELGFWDTLRYRWEENPWLTIGYIAGGALLVIGGVVVTVMTGGLAGFVIGGAIAGFGMSFGVTGAMTHDFGLAVQAGAIGAVAGGIGGAASYGVLAAFGGVAAVGGMSLLNQVGIGLLSGGAGGFAGGFTGGTLGGLAAGQSWGKAIDAGWEAGKTGALWGAAFGGAAPLGMAGVRAARLGWQSFRSLGTVPSQLAAVDALTVDANGMLSPTRAASGWRGWWRGFRVKWSAERMGYDPRLVNYVEEIGPTSSGTQPLGGVRHRVSGHILIEARAFDRAFLSRPDLQLASWRAVLAHEIGHSFGVPAIGATGITPNRNPREFWASYFGGTRVPSVPRTDAASLLRHAYREYY
jgi:YD repeat-containing protein